jgi:hypothetical protein
VNQQARSCHKKFSSKEASENFTAEWKAAKKLLYGNDSNPQVLTSLKNQLQLDTQD